MAVAHAVTQSVEVGKQMAGLLVCEFDDRILVQRDASSDAIIVRWQQVLQELIVSCKPFHLHVSMRRNVTDAGRHGYHYQVVFYDMIAPLIEHKTALASCAEQVHTGMAQFRRIHSLEVGGIQEIYLHNRQKLKFYCAKIHIILYINERFMQKVKIVTLFVKQYYGIIVVTLQSKWFDCEDAHARHN